MQTSYSSLSSVFVASVLFLNLDMSTFVKSTLIMPILVIPKQLSVFLFCKTYSIEIITGAV